MLWFILPMVVVLAFLPLIVVWLVMYLNEHPKVDK